jgi:hypothetical protein
VTATFQALPDVPISTLALTLPAGPNALLGTAKNICTPALSLPYTLSAQNGMQRSSQLSVEATGCPRAHRHRRTKRR